MKIYCQNCKHSKFVECAMSCCGYHCKANPEFYDSAIQPCIRFEDCSTKNKGNDCQDYEVKRKWWKPWAPKILLITLALILCGCVHVKQGDFEYWRFGSQQIGSALLTLPDGSELLLDGQKSELPTVEITATSITIGGKKVKP